MQEIYTARYIVPVASPPVEDGAIVVEGGKILFAGKINEALLRFPDARRINLENVALLPGLINAHVHLELTNLGPRNSVTKLPFPFWLLGIVVGTRIRTQRFFVDAIKKGLKLLKESGTTTAGNIATFIRNPAQYFKGEKIRGIIFLEVLGLNPKEADKIIDSLRKEISELESEELITPACSPHAPYSVSEELFKMVLELSKPKNLPLSIHVAESIDEVRLIKSNRGKFKKIFYPLLGLKRYSPKGRGRTPVKYLNDLGVLTEKTTAVHCVHLHEDDIEILERTGASVILCPRSNHYLGVGSAPLKQLFSSKINLCLATDGLISNSSLSLWDEARFLKERNSWLDSESILKMMTINPARALNHEDRIGALKPGMFGDFIAVDLNGYDNGNIYDFLVNNTTPSRIKGVWVGGENISAR